LGLEMFGDGFAAVFGGEDDVEVVLGVGVRHGAVYIMWGAWFLERDAPSDAGIFTYEACVAPTALGIFCDFSQAFRPGLSYAAPTALVWQAERDGERSQRFSRALCRATRFTRSNARATAVLGNVDAGASWGAALRFGTAESQDESRCSAIHKQRPYE
jgi:hypothetical protein